MPMSKVGDVSVMSGCFMEKPKICFGIGMLIVAAIGIIYLSTQLIIAPTTTNVNEQSHTPEFRNSNGFKWFKHWDELNLCAVKNFYQRYTLDEMQILWDEKLLYGYGNHPSRADADTLYPWDRYIEQLLEFGYPFLDFSDYESALETRMCVLIPTCTYWQTLNTSERKTYLNTQGLPPDTAWETYQEYLMKQSVVYRINWWRSGGMDPF